MESKGAIPKICQVTWKQMLHVAKVVTENEDGDKETPTPPLSFSRIFSP